MKNPSGCVMELLSNANVGDLMTDPTPTNAPWKVVTGQPPLTPDHVIIVNTVPGGRNPFPHLLLNFPSIQIIVRGARSGYAAAYTKMSAVVVALLGMQTTVVQGDTYRSCNQIGDVAYLGEDDNTRPMFSANFWFIVLPAAESGEQRAPIT